MVKIQTREEDNQTNKRIKTIFKKQKGLLKTKEAKAEFKEPIAILMRRTRATEFYENVTEGNWEIEHTDGRTRVLFLDPQFLRVFNYGDTTFTGYICHEDTPTPLPEDPVLTTEITGITLEKTINDVQEWQTKKIKAQTGLVKSIIWGAIGLFVAYVFYRLLIPSGPDSNDLAVANAAAQAAANTPTTSVTVLP